MWLFLIILGIVLTLTGIVGYKKRWFTSFGNPRIIKNVFSFLGVFFAIVGVLMTSFYYVPTKHIGQLTLKYGVGLNEGRVIAINGERGRQGWVLQEGLNIRPFINVLYDIEDVKYTEIEKGQVGLLTSADGEPLDEGLFYPADWVSSDMVHKKDSIEMSMLDPKNFIENGGTKGVQLNVLRPGEYKINRYMWDVDIQPATHIPDGHVGVVISRVGQVPGDIEVGAEGNQLATPVVDKGYMGIWKEPLKPGMYYLNRNQTDDNKGAYVVKLVDTRIQTWTYKGDYSYYTIDLSIEEDGKITQTKSKDFPVSKPDDAADGAIRVISSDGWDVFVDGRILVQVQPQDAPYIIASVGGLIELEDRITTPLMRSVLRNIGESREATTFVWERSKIEKETEERLIEGSDGSRLTIKEFKMNNIYIKPELLVPDKRKQLATKMKQTYAQEQLAYKEKIKTEKAREEAEQQGILVEAVIGNQAAELWAQAEHQKGIGKKNRMIEEALGQAALRDVFGGEKAFALQIVGEFKGFPKEAFQVPFSFNSNGADADPFAFINLNHMIRAAKEMGVDPTDYNNVVAIEEEVDVINNDKEKVIVTPPVENK